MRIENTSSPVNMMPNRETAKLAAAETKSENTVHTNAMDMFYYSGQNELSMFGKKLFPNISLPPMPAPPPSQENGTTAQAIAEKDIKMFTSLLPPVAAASLSAAQF